MKELHKVFSNGGYEFNGIQMFAKDSDYEWAPVDTQNLPFKALTVFNGESRRVRRSFAMGNGIKNFFDALKPDAVVITGWGHPETIPMLRWCEKNDVPAILLCDSQEKDAHRVFWKEFIKRRIVRRFRAAFVAGKPQARYAEKLGISRDRIWFGSCVVDNDYWADMANAIREDSAKNRAMFDLPEKYFLYVGRFIKKKNILTLLQAYSVYRSKTENPFDLLLCGSGQQEKDIRCFIEHHELQGVLLRGFQQADTLPYYYALAECFILPSSHFEQWGLVVNEAMASGLPVIVSDKCGCTEDLVAHGENGFICDPRNAHKLSEHMMEISRTPERCIYMRKRSLEIIDRFSCRQAAHNLYRSVEAVLSDDVN
jgi:glycosyltransferase involved in cell wall biosynthesis